MEHKRLLTAAFFATLVAASAGCGPQRAAEDPQKDTVPVQRYKNCLKDLPNDITSREHCLQLVKG